MGYINFEERGERKIAMFQKGNQEYLGALEYIRVGGWMSWVLSDIPSEDIYFSASCLDEIRKKQKFLNSLIRKDSKKLSNDMKTDKNISKLTPNSLEE